MLHLPLYTVTVTVSVTVTVTKPETRKNIIIQHHDMIIMIVQGLSESRVMISSFRQSESESAARAVRNVAKKSRKTALVLRDSGFEIRLH